MIFTLSDNKKRTVIKRCVLSDLYILSVAYKKSVITVSVRFCPYPNIRKAFNIFVSVHSCLYISFKIVGKVAVNLSKRNTMKSKGIDKETAKELSQAPGEVYAAISMALHEMQDEVHDVEETVLTITRVKRSYSPWSSKIYTLRETPKK